MGFELSLIGTEVFLPFGRPGDLTQRILGVCGASGWPRALKPKSPILHRKLSVKTFHTHVHTPEPVYQMTPEASTWLSDVQGLMCHCKFGSPSAPGHTACGETATAAVTELASLTPPPTEGESPCAISPCLPFLSGRCRRGVPLHWLGPCSTPHSHEKIKTWRSCRYSFLHEFSLYPVLFVFKGGGEWALVLGSVFYCSTQVFRIR